MTTRRNISLVKDSMLTNLSKEHTDTVQHCEAISMHSSVAFGA